MKTDSKIIYPRFNELRDVLSDSVLHSELMGFLRSKGIYYFNTSRDVAAMLTSRLLLSGDDLELIRQYAYRTSQKSLLSGFTLVSESFFDLNSIYETIQEKEVLKKDGYHLKTLEKLGDKKFQGSIVYRKRKPGRNEFLKIEERNIAFSMEALTEKQWQVEIDGESSADGKVIQQMFSLAVKDKKISMEEILFDGLSDANKITFFDRLVKEGLGEEWAIEDVLRLTLKKPKSQTEESDDPDEDAAKDDGRKEAKDDDVKEASKEQLSGIAQAILEGKNLRENRFVHLAEEGGYVFSSMTYMFVRSKDNSHLKIRAEFKGNPKIFEVSLEGFSSTATDAGDDMVMGLSEEDNRKYRSQFWNAAKNIYLDLYKK